MGKAFQPAEPCRCPLCKAAPYAAAIALVAFTACVPTAPELTPLERRGVHAALEGWRAAGLPAPDAERCDFGHVYVRWAKDADEFWQLCRALASEHAACTLWESSNHFFRPLSYPVVQLRPGFVLLPDSEPVIHELMHALTRCAGMPFWLPANTQHLDPRVWSAAEAVPGASAQSRARALMLAP